MTYIKKHIKRLKKINRQGIKKHITKLDKL